MSILSSKRRRAGAGAAAAAIAAAVALLIPALAPAAQPPWRSAERVGDSLFEAQSALLLDERPADPIAGAQRALDGPLERELGRRAPDELRTLRAAVASAEVAFDRGDQTALAAARGHALAALRRGAYAVTLTATRREDLARARGWLLVRDFRQATRFTRPGVDATIALDDLASDELSADEAAIKVKKDLLDAYQARLRSFLDEASQARERGFDPALAESAALVRGYWLILAPEYERQRGAAELRAADSDFAAFERAAISGQGAAFERSRQAVIRDLDGFTAAPFTPEEQALRANQLTRFLDLVPIEYDDGTSGDQVTIPFELQEAVAFLEGAQSAFDDLESTLEERDPQAVATVERAFAELRTYTTDANEGGTVVPVEQVDTAHAEARAALDSVMPSEWQQSSDEADFELIDISLDQMEAAVSASEREQAEQARLTAYAFFEFGPEIKLRAFDPQLVTEIEGLVWYGASGERGLAELIASAAGATEIRQTRVVLDEALEEAQVKVGEGASDGTVITNAAVVVFREGLEAILIIAAITASMIGANRPLRRPVLRGALLALPASVLLFVLAQLLLDSLTQYGEKLEAVVGLVAIAVMLLVLNWFFHRVYWTEWIAGHRKRGKQLIAGAVASTGVASATIVGLYVLGFSSVFREGFETVLFLQALDLSAGTGVVVAGVTLGLLATAAVGAATFALERRLPYKRMLVVTGVMISAVLCVLVGNTVRTLQGVGWMSITPADVEVPLWMGTWLGVFPTVETLGAQAASFAFVIGSYYAAEWWRKRRPRRRQSQRPAVDEPAQRAPAPAQLEPAEERSRVLVGTRAARESANGRFGPSSNGTPGSSSNGTQG